MSLEYLKENTTRKLGRNWSGPAHETNIWRKNLPFRQRLGEEKDRIIGAMIYYLIGIGQRLAFSEVQISTPQDPHRLTNQPFRENSLFEKIVHLHMLVDKIRRTSHNN